MQSLSNELKQVIARRLETATSSDILEIASQLCANEAPTVFAFKPVDVKRFISADGMIEDTATGLIWSANDIGERANWADAQKAAAKSNLGGFRDWRLPTIKELLTLVDYDRHSPAIDSVFSTCKADWYWTSTPYASSPGDCAWGVGFNSGTSACDGQGKRGLVRAVRSRQ